jgi:4'-phosphopantetheinyl transferase
MEVWVAELLQPPELIEGAAATLLPPADARRREGESDTAWRRRIAARAAVRIVLSRRTGLDPAALRFRRGSAGKPELVGPAGRHVCFNVSHSGELCVVAIGDAEPVGVDVEAIRPVGHLEQIAARFGAEDSAAILRLRGERRLRAFHAIWTRREACLKAAGTGLLGGLAPEVERGWTVIGLELGDRHAGALAVPATTPRPPRSIAPHPLPLEAPV